MRIRELERIYGIKHGGDRKSSTNNSDLISQSTVANQLGISIDTLNNYKMLAEMIPELSDLVDTGIAKIIVLNKKKNVCSNLLLTQTYVWMYSRLTTKRESPFTGCRP